MEFNSAFKGLISFHIYSQVIYNLRHV